MAETISTAEVLPPPAAAAPAAARVLLVSHEVEFGGAERSLVDLLRALDRSRFAPLLACSGDGPLARAATALGVPMHRVPMLFAGRLAKLAGLRRAAAALRELIAAQGVGLVHANTLIAGYCGLAAARSAGVPCVWHVRDLTYPWLARRAARRASWRIANSAATARVIGGAGTTVVYNGVDARFFAPPDSRETVRGELGLGPAARLVAIAGRLDPAKGHRVLLDAAARLLLRVPELHVVVLGDVALQNGRRRLAGYRDELERRATRLGLADRVHFLGAREDVPRWLAACDVLAHPTETREAFGRSIAEAQALGLPVVASRLGGIPEVIEDGVDGLLVPPRDPAALADKLSELLSDPALRARIGAAARRRAERCWTAAAHARAVEQVYDRVLVRR